MKDFRKTVNWKKFSEEFPIYSDNGAIIVCRIDPDSYDIEDDEFTVGYLEYCPYAPYNVGLSIPFLIEALASESNLICLFNI